jgi:hypothetical protein
MKQITWKTPKLQDQKSSKSPDNLGMHWISVAYIDGAPVGRMYCLKSDCKCYVEDDSTGECVEFNGAQAQGQRIAEKMFRINELDMWEDCTTLRWVNFTRRKPTESISTICRIGKHEELASFYIGGYKTGDKTAYHGDCVVFRESCKFFLEEYKNERWVENFGSDDMYWLEETIDMKKFEKSRA